MIMDEKRMLRITTLICLLVMRLSSSSAVFGNMETFLELPALDQQSFYVLQEDVFQPGTIIAALENAVVSISPEGEMVTIAGSPTEDGYREGEASLFKRIQGIHQLNETALIVSDYGNNCLRLIDRRTGNTTTYTGECGSQGAADGSLDEARFTAPTDIKRFGDAEKMVVVEFIGNLRRLDIGEGMVDTITSEQNYRFTHFLYISHREFYIISKTAILYSMDSTLAVYSGLDTGFVDANRTESRYRDLQGVVRVTPDTMIVADRSNSRLRVVPRDGQVQSVCSGTVGHENGDITSCKLHKPYSLMIMNGKLYVGESGYYGGGIRTLPFTIGGNCPSPQEIENGFYYPQNIGYSPGDLVTYECRDGYERVGSNYQLTCNNSTEWQGELPTCQEVPCDPPPSVEFADFSPIKLNYSISEIVQYTCREGYELVGAESSLVCSGGGIWEGVTPVCSAPRCEQPSVVLHGTYYPSEQSFSPGDVIQFTCDSGYQLHSREEDALTCSADGDWIGTPPLCVVSSVVTCGLPRNVDHASYYPEKLQYEINDTVEYTCDADYKLDDSVTSRINCNPNGNWEGASPVCTELTCSSPTEIPNASPHPIKTEYRRSDVVLYICSDGYELLDADTKSLSCGADGFWDGITPLCQLLSVVNCDPPRDVDHASYYPEKVQYEINDSVEYTCDAHYKLDDSVTSRINCNPNGNWEGASPVCTGKAESSSAAIIGGSVGGGALLLCTVLVILYWRYRRAKKNDVIEDPPPVYMEPIGMRPPMHAAPPPPDFPPYSYVEAGYFTSTADSKFVQNAEDVHCYELGDEESICRDKNGSVIRNGEPSHLYDDPADIGIPRYENVTTETPKQTAECDSHM